MARQRRLWQGDQRENERAWSTGSSVNLDQQMSHQSRGSGDQVDEVDALEPTESSRGLYPFMMYRCRQTGAKVRKYKKVYIYIYIYIYILIETSGERLRIGR